MKAIENDLIEWEGEKMEPGGPHSWVPAPVKRIGALYKGNGNPNPSTKIGPTKKRGPSIGGKEEDETFTKRGIRSGTNLEGKQFH